MTACSDGSGNPAGEPGKGGKVGDGKRGTPAIGRFWSVSETSRMWKRTPRATVFDMEKDDSLRSAPLSREPLQIALTPKYAFVNCKGGLLARIHRETMAIDSVAVGKALHVDDAQQFRLAADAENVWMAHAKEGLVHLDPETLAEKRRLTFSSGTATAVNEVILKDGKPWFLIAAWDFRLFQLDPSAYKTLVSIPLSRNRIDPAAPSQGGNGAMAFAGDKALVLDHSSRTFIRVDLASAKVEDFWDTDWFGADHTGILGRVHGHDGGFLVTHKNEKWVRTYGLTGRAHEEFVTPWWIDAQKARKADGLFAMGYRTLVATGEVGLYRPAVRDTAGTVWDAHEAVDIAFEE
jgi:hypothetical protein